MPSSPAFSCTTLGEKQGGCEQQDMEDEEIGRGRGVSSYLQCPPVKRDRGWAAQSCSRFKFCLKEEKWFLCNRAAASPARSCTLPSSEVERSPSCRDGTDIPGNPIGLATAAADTTGCGFPWTFIPVSRIPAHPFSARPAAPLHGGSPRSQSTAVFGRCFHLVALCRNDRLSGARLRPSAQCQARAALCHPIAGPSPPRPS